MHPGPTVQSRYAAPMAGIRMLSGRICLVAKAA
jgi:hypothetical protein